MSRPQIVLAVSLVPALLLGAVLATVLVLGSTKAPRSPWGRDRF